MSIKTVLFPQNFNGRVKKQKRFLLIVINLKKGNLSDFNEAPALVLFDIDVEPLVMNAEHFTRDLIVRHLLIRFNIRHLPITQNLFQQDGTQTNDLRLLPEKIKFQ